MTIVLKDIEKTFGAVKCWAQQYQTKTMVAPLWMHGIELNGIRYTKKDYLRSRPNLKRIYS